MKPHLVIIDGPINSGKSSVSKVLGKLLPKTIIMELDYIRHFADCLSLNDSIPYTLRDSGQIANNWINRNFNVVIDYPMDDEDYEIFSNEIDEQICQIIKFSLAPSIEVALRNRGSRELSDHEKKRIKEQYNERNHRELLGQKIDNSSLSVDDTAKLILSYITQQKTYS